MPTKYTMISIRRQFVGQTVVYNHVRRTRSNVVRTFAPRNLRPYQRFVNRLTPYFPRLWYVGIPVIAITSLVTGHDTFWVLLACNLTIYPALFIFFSLPAIGAIWRILLRAPIGKPISAWLGFLLVLAFPTVFFCFGFLIYASAIWHMVSAA